ncbi:SemiSWEET transporter [Vibrio brasiliensis]
MESASTIGYLAACLTTLSFLPQAIRVIKTHDTRGISLTMYLMFVTGLLMWLVYGVLIDNAAVIWANLMTFVFALPILVLKYRAYRHSRNI